MKVPIPIVGKSDILERARDCFVIGQEVAELRCSLQGAVHELSERDMSWAKTYLYDAADHARKLSQAYPDRALAAKKILRGINKVAKEISVVSKTIVTVPLQNELKKKITILREASQNLRASAKVHCNVPLPFEEKRKAR